MRRLRLGAPLALALSLAPALGSCGGATAGIQPRVRAAPGASIRYHTVLRTLPFGRPGRTISAVSALTVRDAAAEDRYDVTVTWTPVHVAGEAGHVVPVNGQARASFVRDARRRVEGALRVEGDVEAAHDLARVLEEEIVLPDGALAPGASWPLPEVTRTLGDGSRVTIPRTARLASVDDGVARIEVAGRAEGGSLSVHGVSASVDATLSQTFRLRVADALLVEMESRSEIVLSTPTGRATHREEALVSRVFGAPPGPEAHGYRPGGHPSACESRLRAMRTRFDRTPRNVDLDAFALASVDVPVRPTGEPLDEVGPVLVGTDDETLIGATATNDVVHTVTVYVAAPPELADDDLRTTFDGIIGAGIDIRRIVRGQVHPPSPAPSEEVLALARRMREARSVEPWRAEMQALTALCDAAAEAYELAEAAEPAQRAAAMRQGLLAAYERCGCDSTDLARLERTLDLRLGGPDLAWEPVR
ncbi:MAG: hypothetical protein M5U28_56140 [Sandaracinaceae bacterium]|nr:hypothetical protein [Sandaracinaceae bacterium]